MPEKAAREEFQRNDSALLASFSTLVAAQARTSYRHQDLKDLVVGLTRALTAAIDAKDSYTAGHSERVARMSMELGKELGLPEEQLNDIYLAGLLHDIGKIGIRDEVLSKPGRLTDEERRHINEHVVIGHRILSGLTGIDHLLPGVLYHHEHFNGSGYPEGLTGDRIPRLARIIAVADSFDAMSSDRPYRVRMPPQQVENVLREGAGKQWDPVIIDAFIKCKDRLCDIRQRGIGDSLREALNGAMRQDQYKEDASLNFNMRNVGQS
jgi:HD-GYP domain-containing protein (c-di-GMP phosphodiesterase class II)